MTDTQATTTRDLTVQALDSISFSPFGTVIGPQPDGTPYGLADAVLNLGLGTPRFYTMTVPARGLAFDAITHHKLVTQVLCSSGGNEWSIAVAPPGELDVDAIEAFRVPGDTAIMLNVGTWHAGPLFDTGDQNFFNLELRDTNVVDHHTANLVAVAGVTIRLVEPRS